MASASADDILSSCGTMSDGLPMCKSVPTDVLHSDDELTSSDINPISPRGTKARRRLVRSKNYSHLHSDGSSDIAADSANYKLTQRKINHEDSVLTLSSEEDCCLSSVGHSIDDSLANSDAADLISTDSGVLFSEHSSTSHEADPDRETTPGKKIVYLPRSGSTISRKKAFYNARRPDSICRRGSDANHPAANTENRNILACGDLTESVSSDNESKLPPSDEKSYSVTETKSLRLECDLKEVVDTALTLQENTGEDVISPTISITSSHGVYSPLGFRSSTTGARPVGFLSNRLSSVHVNDVN